MKLPFSILSWRFWLAFWDVRPLLRSLKCGWNDQLKFLEDFIVSLQQNFKWMCQYTWNCKTSDFSPEGRLLSEKRGECFAPCLCFCAAARGRHSNWPPRAEEKAQNAENHQLRQLCETALVHYVLKGTCQSDCIPGEVIWNLKTDLTCFPLNFY